MNEKEKITKILNDADMYGDYTLAISGIQGLLKECYNQAIEDAYIVSCKEYLEESIKPILELKKK